MLNFKKEIDQWGPVDGKLLYPAFWFYAATKKVARELRNPCVIGTRVATKVFKDGDLVEVDADKGVVRKI